MIARIWKGLAHRVQVNKYLRHLEAETLELAAIEGFVRISVLQREMERGIEFLIMTVWQSEEAVKQFAGDMPTRAVVPQVIQDMMIEYDEYAAHYEIKSETYA